MLYNFFKNFFLKQTIFTPIAFTILILINVKFIPIYNLYIFEWLILLITFLHINFLGVVEFFKINLLSTLIFLISLLMGFFSFNLYNNTTLINFGAFFKLNAANTINLTFYIDYINYNFSLLTVFIAFSVYLYVYVYMRFELNIINFFFFLKCFVLSMILLLWAGNWVTLILG